MRKRFLSIVAVSALSFVLTGCYTSVDGRREPGTPFVKDRISAVYERPVMQVWASTKDVLNTMGTIVNEDVMQSTVSARIDEKTVRVKVEELDKKNTRVTVQCRTKMGGSDVVLAGEVDKQIAIRLATGTLSPVPPPGAK